MISSAFLWGRSGFFSRSSGVFPEEAVFISFFSIIPGVLSGTSFPIGPYVVLSIARLVFVGP